MPERRPAAKNFSQAADAHSGPAATRYIAETVEVVDENGYGDTKSVQVAKRNLSLLFGNQNLDGFVTLRIARVVRHESRGYVLDPDFIAPSLSIAATERLMGLLRRQIEILVSKADSLNANRRERQPGLADLNASEAAMFWQLQTVNSAIPELQHIYNVQRGHPERLWSVMLRLAGALATFSMDFKAHDLPQYDHEDLGRCFTVLDEKIRGLLDILIKSKCVSIPLHHPERSLWTGTVSNDDHFKNSAFYLAINAKIGIDELVSKVPQLVKVSPPDEMQNLIRLALPGITLRHANQPPSAITFKLNNQYFSLNQTGRLWDRIVQSRSISLFIPPEIAEAQPEILVVLQ